MHARVIVVGNRLEASAAADFRGIAHSVVRESHWEGITTLLVDCEREALSSWLDEPAGPVPFPIGSCLYSTPK